MKNPKKKISLTTGLTFLEEKNGQLPLGDLLNEALRTLRLGTHPELNELSDRASINWLVEFLVAAGCDAIIFQNGLPGQSAFVRFIDADAKEPRALDYFKHSAS